MLLVTATITVSDAPAAEALATCLAARWGGAVPRMSTRSLGDVRFLPRRCFIVTFSPDFRLAGLAEEALREAKALDMGGIKKRSAYLMGVLQRKVREADKIKAEKEALRRSRQGQEKRNAGAKRGELAPPAFEGKKTKLDE